MAELLRLKKGVPEIVSLAYSEGKMIESQHPGAPPSIMFTLVDGRRTFLPMSAAEQIRRACVTARTPIELLKLGEDDYRVRCLGGGAASTAPSASNYYNEQPNSTAAPVQHAPAPVATTADRDDSPRRTVGAKFMAAYKVAVDVLLETRVYAQQKGLALEVRCEDVRCLAATIMIDQKGGR